MKIYENNETIIIEDNRMSCLYCNRLFNEDSHVIHQNICLKIFITKHQKQFKSINQRISDIKSIKPTRIYLKSKLNTSWRLQSQMFLEAIRQAKAGIKLGDGRIDDRVMCQTCQRKFKADVAQRHIPNCKKNACKIRL